MCGYAIVLSERVNVMSVCASVIVDSAAVRERERARERKFVEKLSRADESE